MLQKFLTERTLFSVIVVFLFLFIFSLSANAATVTWTGAVDDLASKSDNWSGGLVPQNGDEVVFDATSSIDCTWDIYVVPASLTLDSGYTGTVTLNSELTVTGNVVISGGTLKQSNKNLYVGFLATEVPPYPPTGLTATAVSSSQIDLSWTDNSENEAGFKIEYKIGVGGTYTQIGTVGIDATTYPHTGLTPGTTYFYRVRAYNETGNSTYSNEASATTLVFPKPTTTTNPATDVEGYSATLNATVNPNSSDTTAYFEWGLDLSYGNTTTVQSAGSGISNVSVTASLTDLLPGTTYHYRVVATNVGGTSYGSDMSFTTPGWYDIDWLYRQKIISKQQITLLSGMAPSTDLTNFPVLIKITDQTNPIFDKALVNGDDIVFTLSDGITRLDHEIESYDNSLGNKELVAWVKIPTLPSSSDMIIYMYYGNNDASIQQNPEGVWGSGYKGVWHLKEDEPDIGSIDLYKDSTANDNDGDDYISATGKNGQINSGQEFDGIDDYIDVADNASLDITDKITVEAWVYLRSTSGYREVLSKGDDRYLLYFSSDTTVPMAGLYQSGYVALSFGSSINFNEWTYLVFTYDMDGGINNFKTYINGILSSTDTRTGPIETDDNPLSIGSSKYWDIYEVFFDGFIDEVRISDIIRSADWIKASYNNQGNLESYLIFGSEENYIPLLPPTAITNTASDIISISATLNATVNPNGSETTVYFEWGTTSIPYDNTTTSQSIGNGTGNVNVTEILSDLSTDTAYYYRVVAYNDIGRVYGDEMSFTTTTSKIWIGTGDASIPANWSGGAVPQDGDDVVFDSGAAGNCIWDINPSLASFSMYAGFTGTIILSSDLTITGNLDILGGTLDLNNKNLNVDGYLMVGPDGTLNATSSTITVKGAWANWGNFIPGTSTVILNGTNQTIYGNTTFYNLIKTVTTADTLYFQAGSTQTIVNNLTLEGANGNLLSLRSTVDGEPWYIDPQGTRNIAFVDIKDLYNLSFTNIVITNSQDSGNNDGVSFGGDECVCKENFLIYSLLNPVKKQGIQLIKDL